MDWTALTACADMDELRRALIAYVPACTVLSLGTYLLEPDVPLLQLTTGGAFMFMWAYWTHRLWHTFPYTGVFYYLNPHLSIHHAEQKQVPRWLDIVIEALQNLFWFVPLYILQECTQIHIVPTSIILFGALIYASIHLVNYTFFTFDKHVAQHKDPNVNFGPDILDHIFGTNSDPSFEPMHHFIPNALASYLLIRYIDG
jgi:hypothetical protein